MDRIEQWRIFIAVASQRSFVDASRKLGRSPQGVTRAIAALEARLGRRLLNRTTRSVSLTGDGQRWMDRASAVLGEFDQLESVDDQSAPLTGRLSVTAPVLFGQLHVLPVLAVFLRRHPGVDARLELLDRVVSLAEEGVDLGVRFGALPDSSLRALLIGQIRQVHCASPALLEREGTPTTPDLLARHSCIAFTSTTPVIDRWSFPGRGTRERTVAVRPRLVVNTGQAAIDAAVAGLGVARVPSYLVTNLVAQNKLRIVLQAFEARPIPVQLVRLPGAPIRAAQVFAEFALARIRERLESTATAVTDRKARSARRG